VDSQAVDNSAADAADWGGGDELALGIYCRRRHFNDPEMAYCTVCGISMAQSSRTRVWGKRPPLGVLVLDDGTIFSLMRDFVLGRVPEADQSVILGQADQMRFTDMSVSRVHARITLDGWDVVVEDQGSTNGTFVCLPGQSSWTRLAPGVATTLPTGGSLAVGRRQLRYHSQRMQARDFSTGNALFPEIERGQANLSTRQAA
jgi:hypothetical protein